MKKTAGFTLVELLVVVAIIGFLSAIGVVIFADAQSKGRDAKRKGDIDSIAKALELHKTDDGYQKLDADWFGSSTSLPTEDPKGDQYCIQSSTSSDRLADADTSSWDAEGECVSVTDKAYAVVSETTPTDGDDAWTVCAKLENPVNGNSVYCRSSLQ